MAMDKKPGIAAMILESDDKKPEMDDDSDSSGDFDSAVQEFKTALKSDDDEALGKAFKDLYALCKSDYETPDKE
jgi:hypothetical protein